MADLGYCVVLNRRHKLDDFHSIMVRGGGHTEVCRNCGRNPQGALIQR